MNNFIHELNTNPSKYNPIELAAFAHHKLVRIHPFVDGNGRVARLLCNLVLLKKGYPPVVIRVNDRKKYFARIENAHIGDLKKFADFITLRVEESLIGYMTSLAKATQKNELLPLKELAKSTPYSQEYLSLLARRGILAATKINNAWHSTKEELKRYVESISQK